MIVLSIDKLTSKPKSNGIHKIHKKARKKERKQRNETHAKMKKTLESQCIPRNRTIHCSQMQKNPHRMCSVKIYVLKNFANSTGKKPILESLFNKVAGLQACIFIKKRLQHRCFPVNIAKSLRGPILK